MEFDDLVVQYSVSELVGNFENVECKYVAVTGEMSCACIPSYNVIGAREPFQIVR